MSLFGSNPDWFSAEFDLGTGGGCPVGASADTCTIDSSTNQATAIDAGGGTDTLQLGGPDNFSFALGGLGTTYTNFENLEKTGANTVTLTGTGAFAGSLKNTAGILNLATNASLTGLSGLTNSATLSLGANSTLAAGTITNNAGATIHVGAGAKLQGTGNTLNNAGVTNLATNGIVTDAGDINNLATGVFNFNGPGGTATLSSGGPNGIVNDGQIHVLGGDVSVTGSITNNNLLNLAGGNMSGVGTLTAGASSITNIDLNRTLSVGTFTSILGGDLTGAGTLNASSAFNLDDMLTLTTLAGNGQLNKQGGGNVVLGGTNTYTGGTFVNQGILALQGGSAIVDSGAVTVASGATLALTANETIGSVTGAVNSTIALNNNVLTTGGNNAVTTFAGAITGNGGLTKAGNGNFTLSGPNSYLGATQVNGGTLTLSGGGAIADTGSIGVLGGATLAVATSETIGSLAGAGALALTGTLTTGGNNNTTSWTGTTSGNGGLTKLGTGTFTVGNLGHTGVTTVSGGTMVIGNPGPASVAGSVVVNSGAILQGAFNIAGNLTLNAGGQLRPGNSPGTDIVGGNYIGGGTIQVEVQFNNAGAPINGTTHDFLTIGGNTSNTTVLQIVPFAPSTAPVATVGNGIELVRVAGPTSASAFVLSGPVVQGGYEYALKYLADYSGSTDGFFLQSGVRQEIAAAAGAQMGSAALNAACSSADSRIDAAKNARRQAWLTGETGSLETGADSGLVSDADTTCVNTGMTFASGLPGLNMGFSLGMGSYDGTLALISGPATLEGSRFGAEAILTYARDMLFATAAAGFASQDFEFEGTLFRNTGSASGMTANLAAGVHLPVAGVADVTLAGIFDYNDAVCRDACFGFASYAEGDAIMTGTLRAGAKAQFGPFSPYGALSYSTVFSDDPAPVLGAPVASFSGDGLMAATLGASVALSPAASLFVEGRYKESMDVDATGQSVAAGLRAAW